MMESQAEYDVRISDHQEWSTRVNQEGWRLALPARRPLREIVAVRLIALALRLAPSVGRADVLSSPLASATQA